MQSQKSKSDFLTNDPNKYYKVWAVNFWAPSINMLL